MSDSESSSQRKSSKDRKARKRKTELGNLAIDVEKQDEFTEKVKLLPSESAEDKASGVVYVGHIPHGFYEKEMRKFFAQFGTVKRVRLSRSKKTAASKGYAFVEFAYEDVARIAAETMDNYLMFDRLLKCKFIPKERLHPRMWQGANRKFKKIDWAQKERQNRNKPKTVTVRNKQVGKLLSKEKKEKEKNCFTWNRLQIPWIRKAITAWEAIATGYAKELPQRCAATIVCQLSSGSTIGVTAKT